DAEQPGVKYSDEGRTLDAPAASIEVDGNAEDWSAIEGVDMTLYAIAGEESEAKEASVKVAHDDEFVYAMFQVEDDLNWDPENAHLSAANAVQWAIEPGGGEAMGATDEERETSLGLVDIWHWELGCDTGQQSGGSVSGPGDGNDPGNDDACNFDDEYATTPTEREDDNLAGAENSLLGVWTHSASAENEPGMWTFEMSRPLQTGDEADAQFEVGSSAKLALAYWDADSGPEGWHDDHHVQSGNQGWIIVEFK
ncbi:MAG: ethylbenzene dehydrogenase-related protein, partial [Acidimicrobiales bacterium]